MLDTMKHSHAGNDIATALILSFLADSGTEFFLTGSRFFGTDQLSSDWDFFTGPLSLDLADALHVKGFRILPVYMEPYFDDVTECVYRWNPIADPTFSFGHNQIDIQVLKADKLYTKIKARDLLRSCPVDILPTNKIADRSRVWNWAYAVVERK